MRFRTLSASSSYLRLFALALALWGPAHADYNAGMAALGVKDYARARVEFEGDAENGKAVYELALMCQHGLGEPKDMQRRAALLKRAAALGHLTAKLEWAAALGNGTGVPAHPEEALRILHDAEEDPRAAVYLAGLYRYGWWGTPVDLPRSTALLKAAADKGSLLAMGRYGMALIGAVGTPPDPERGLALLRAAVEGNDPDAQYEYAGLLTRGGAGVTANPAEGVALYRKLAEQRGDAGAQAAVCQAYLGGDGVPRDAATAARWCDAAARQGDPWAQTRLGDMFRLGLGVPRLQGYAYYWYTLAAQGNFEIANEARRRLADLARGMSDDEIRLQAKRAKAFVPETGLRVRAEALPELARENHLTLGTVSITVPAPDGYVNNWELLDSMRRVMPNHPELRPVVMTFAHREDLTRFKLGGGDGFRSVDVEVTGDDREPVGQAVFDQLRQQLRTNVADQRARGLVRVEQLRDDAGMFSYVRTSLIGHDRSDGWAFVLVRARLLVFIFRDFSQGQTAELRALVEKTTAELVTGNSRRSGGFFSEN